MASSMDLVALSVNDISEAAMIANDQCDQLCKGVVVDVWREGLNWYEGSKWYVKCWSRPRVRERATERGSEEFVWSCDE